MKVLHFAEHHLTEAAAASSPSSLYAADNRPSAFCRAAG